MNKEQIDFTHYWVSGFGWEVTVFLPSDFVEVKEFGRFIRDEIVFIGINQSGGQHILKGKYL
jgi:hypothetical protein